MKETMALPRLTEATIRAGATERSFERGRDYYRRGALYDMAIRGRTLVGGCTGRSAPAYSMQVELGEDGVQSASCTCPYDWGGWCKHIVALMLAYVHGPQRFEVRPEPAQLLAGLDGEALRGLWLRLLAERPQMYDWLAAAVGAPGMAPGEPADPALYRRQVGALVRALGDSYRYDRYGMAGELVGHLQDMEATAQDYLQAGDARSALEVLLAILEGVASHFDSVGDPDGGLSGFVNGLGVPMAEAVLSLDAGEGGREAWARRLRRLSPELDEYCAGEAVDVALAALRDGWSGRAGPDDELTIARLNVLARQGHDEEYLALCRRLGRHVAYALKLCDLGRPEEAAAYAVAHLEEAQDARSVARRLQELGHTAAALALGERGLALEAPRWPLAEWLAPLEEAGGRTPQALEARLVVLAEDPSLAAYRAVKRLAGPAWPALQPQAMASLEASRDKTALAEVLVLEQQWDAAIALAEGERYADRLRAIVAEGVAGVRPDWVARVSVARAEALLVVANTGSYPPAAEWLRRARDAYAAMGRGAEWRAYLEALKARYKRRPALQRELRGV